MRTNLKVLRVKQNLTQEEASAAIGCSRQAYASIESGMRKGTISFWAKVQNAFNVPDEEMWGMIRDEQKN